MSIDVELVAHHLLDFLEHGVLIDTPKGARGLGCNMLAHCVSLVYPWDGNLGMLPSNRKDRSEFLTSRRNLGRQALSYLQERFPERVRVFETKLRPISSFFEAPLHSCRRGKEPFVCETGFEDGHLHTEAYIERWFLGRPQTVVVYARASNYSNRRWRLDWERLQNSRNLLDSLSGRRPVDRLFHLGLVRLAIQRYRRGDVRNLRYVGTYPPQGGGFATRAPSLVYYTTPDEQTPLNPGLRPGFREHEGALVHVFFSDGESELDDEDGTFLLADLDCDVAEIW